MSDSPEDRAMATVKKAEQMIKDVQRTLEDGDDFFRRQGLDRSKATAFCEKSMSADDRRKAEELLKQDLAEIDEEVHQAKLRQGDEGGSSKAKRPRSMV